MGEPKLSGLERTLPAESPHAAERLAAPCRYRHIVSYCSLTSWKAWTMTTTRLSSKGQVIIPKDIRDEHGWRPGTTFEIEDTPGGLLLRPKPVAPATTVDEVFGCLAYGGPPISIEQMGEAVAEEAKRRSGR